MAQVRRVSEEIGNAGDLAVADVLFAPTSLNHGGLIPDLVQGPEAIKVAVPLYGTAVPAFHITVASLTAEQEMVEVAWAAYRTGSAADHAAAEQTEAVNGTTRSRPADGQIKESWTHGDRAGALRHLGIDRSAAGPRGGGHEGPAATPPGKRAINER